MLPLLSKAQILKHSCKSQSVKALIIQKVEREREREREGIKKQIQCIKNHPLEEDVCVEQNPAARLLTLL